MCNEQIIWRSWRIKVYIYRTHIYIHRFFFISYVPVPDFVENKTHINRKGRNKVHITWKNPIPTAHSFIYLIIVNFTQSLHARIVKSCISQFSLRSSNGLARGTVNFLFLLPGWGFLKSLVSFLLYRSIDYTVTVKIDRLKSLKLYAQDRQSYLGATSFLLFFFFYLAFK